MSTDIQLKSGFEYDKRSLEIIKNNIAPAEATIDNVIFFIEMCRAQGLNPFLKDVFMAMSKGRVILIVSFQALVKKARQTRIPFKFIPTEFLRRDGKTWVTEWLYDTEVPMACRVGIRFDGQDEPVTVTVRMASYLASTGWWVKAPEQMLEKCAKARLLRQEMEGMEAMYISEEMDGIDREEKVQRGTIQPQAQTLQIEGQTVTIEPPKLGINERRALATTLEEINALWAEAQQTEHWQAWDGTNREKCRTSFIPFADKFGGKWMEAENKFMTEAEVMGETSQADFLQGLEENPDSVGNGSDFKTQFPTT